MDKISIKIEGNKPEPLEYEKSMTMNMDKNGQTHPEKL
jgi:hypothetical protein